MKNKIKKVAVLGSGVMGAQIAGHLANAGISSLLFDLKKSDVENVKKLVGLPNMVKVISENPIMIARGASALSKISPSSAAGAATAIGQGLSKISLC